MLKIRMSALPIFTLTLFMSLSAALEMAAQTNKKTVTVSGTNATGTNTGISLSANDKIKFTTVTGTFRFNADKPGRAMTFQGADEIKDRQTYAFPTAAPYSLVGWIGNDKKTAFQVSKLPAQTYTATGSGVLFLAINDEANRYTDNTGGYAVTVELTGGGQPTAPSTANAAQTAGKPSPSAALATKFPILAGTGLKRGIKYPSPSGNHVLTFANDGNLVVATKDGGFVWGLNDQTKNYAQSDRVEVTPEGRLAVYDAKGKVIWTTPGKPDANAKLNLTFGGALQLVSATGEILWASDGNISPVTTVIKSANVKPCQTDAVWSKCIEMPDPKITIRGTKLVSDSAMNAVANVYTELTKRFKPAYPRSTFDGFLVYMTNGEPGSQLDKMKALEVFGENGRGSNSRNLVRGGANYNLLWIEEQMICKAGVKTVNADYPDKADYTLRTYDQVIHEFGHAIDQRYKLGQRIQSIFPGGAPGEDFAWAIQRWFGSPGGASPPSQEALMKELFASRATFSCEGLKP